MAGFFFISSFSFSSSHIVSFENEYEESQTVGTVALRCLAFILDFIRRKLSYENNNNCITTIDHVRGKIKERTEPLIPFRQCEQYNVHTHIVIVRWVLNTNIIMWKLDLEGNDCVLCLCRDNGTLNSCYHFPFECYATAHNKTKKKRIKFVFVFYIRSISFWRNTQGINGKRNPTYLIMSLMQWQQRAKENRMTENHKMNWMAGHFSSKITLKTHKNDTKLRHFIESHISSTIHRWVLDFN